MAQAGSILPQPIRDERIILPSHAIPPYNRKCYLCVRLMPLPVCPVRMPLHRFKDCNQPDHAFSAIHDLF
jgi:hypothetical protein